MKVYVSDCVFIDSVINNDILTNKGWLIPSDIKKIHITFNTKNMKIRFFEWYEDFCDELYKNKHERKIDRETALLFFEEGLSVKDAVECYITQFG